MIDDLPGAVTSGPDVVRMSAALRSAFGPAVVVDAITFRTGAIRVTVRLGGRSGLLWTDADTAAWTCSDGHAEHVADSPEAAVEMLATCWAAQP